MKTLLATVAVLACATSLQAQAQIDYATVTHVKPNYENVEVPKISK